MAMNKTNIAIALLDNVTAVEVKFQTNGGTYTYLVHGDTVLEVGDKVVVNTPNANLQVVEVTKTDVQWDIDERYTFKFIVQKLDLTNYNAINEAVEGVRAEIERSRKEAARAQVREMLQLKADAVARIADISKSL